MKQLRLRTDESMVKQEKYSVKIVCTQCETGLVLEPFGGKAFPKEQGRTDETARTTEAFKRKRSTDPIPRKSNPLGNAKRIFLNSKG